MLRFTPWLLTLVVSLTALVLPLNAAADSGQGPDLELICPCSLASASSSSMAASFGVVNRGSSSSGELVMRIYAHTESRYSQAADLKFLGDIPVSGSLAANSTIPLASRVSRMGQPDAGTYYITFLLLENNTVVDRTMMASTVTFGNVASSSYSELYFVADPVATINGDTLSLDLPAIGNSGTRNESLEVFLAAGQSADFFGGSFFRIGDIPAVTSVAAGSQTSADSLEFQYSEQPGFEYIYLVVTDGASTLLLHSLDAPGVVFDEQNFSVTGVDFLIDTDGDGVADENERLMGTDPAQSSSVPGKTYIDLFAVYSTGVTSEYSGDPSARLDHLVAFANQVLADSRVEIEFRLVGSRELAMDTSQNISQWLKAAEQGEGVFADLEQMREDAGADLVTLFRLYDGGNTCGLASLGGFATQGLMERSSYISASFIEFDECSDNTMIHEIGHNMGLGHSYKQNESGTFVWSRGHGETGNFATMMAYASEFDVFNELPYFSNPEISACEGKACGIKVDQTGAADAASSLNAVRFQVAAYANAADADQDADGVPDASDAFPGDAAESVDTDGDGLGDNADYDDDNDGMPDSWEIARGHDPKSDDGAADDDNNGSTNLEEYLATPRAAQYLQTNSTSANITRLHVVNTAGTSQAFTGTLFDGSGQQLGAAYQSLGSGVAPDGRLVLTSADLEQIFAVDPWSGPAMLEVTGEADFELMSKLASPSGLVSNTNCVRESRVLNIEGFDSENMTFVRFINTGNNALGSITGTLYDADGEIIGAAGVELLASMAPKQQVWINRNNFAALVGVEWNGEAMLEVSNHAGLKLLNLNFVNAETFFNFSCFEDASSATVYLQTTSNSPNVSLTHLVNTSDASQQFTGTLYTSNGEQSGSRDAPLHDGLIAPRGRLILSSSDIEARLGAGVWNGPAMLEVKGTGDFELMTKLRSPSGLISNTNCVRRGEVHNIEGFDSPDTTFVRFINTGDTTMTNIIGTLYDASGNVVGAASQELLSALGAKQQSWLNRNQLQTIFDGTWNGEALLSVEAGDDLRLLNLNYINSETFFNFSCYEASQ